MIKQYKAILIYGTTVFLLGLLVFGLFRFLSPVIKINENISTLQTISKKITSNSQKRLTLEEQINELKSAQQLLQKENQELRKQRDALEISIAKAMGFQTGEVQTPTQTQN